MKALKTFFLGRMMREKLLLLVFLGVAVAVWLSSLGGRTQRFYSSFSRASADLQTQAMWLGRKSQIEQNSKNSISRLDPAQTLDGTKLQAEINRIAAEAGLATNVTVDDNREEPSTYFKVHTVRFTARKADYATLIRFYQEIQKRSPYIGIEQFALGAEPNPAQLNASFRLSSVEVVK